ncbi:MAG: hypothetical protein ACQESA_00665 [Patescibacteria group bacterium]
MKTKGILPLLAILFAVIVLGSTAMLSASPETSTKHKIYERGDALKATARLYNDNTEKGEDNWIEELNRVIPPKEQKRLKESSSSDLTVTERFLSDLFKNLQKEESLSSLTAENLSSEIETDKYEIMMNEFIEGELKEMEDEHFALEDLDIKQGYSKKDVREYGNEVGEIILRNSPGLDHQLDLFQDLVVNSNQQARLDLIKISEGYRKIAEEVASVEVPEGVAQTHLGFVNGMRSSGSHIENMAQVKKDPILGLISAESYLKRVASGAPLEISKELKLFFKKEGVFYGPKDPGAAFNLLGELE